MGARSWARPVGHEADARVTLESADSAAEIRYRLAFPFLVGDDAPDDLQVTGEGRIADHQLRSEDGLPVSDLVVVLPADADMERLIVRSRPERLVIHLPSPDLLETCDRAVDGDTAAVERLIDRFASPVQLPLVCGSFLELEDTLGLVAELVGHDRHVQSMLHSYRYAVVRSALVTRTGLHVGTYRELVDLVEGLDAIPDIGDVALVDALADVVATVHDTPEETERLLDALDVDLERLFDRDDGLFAACFLAHLACSSGVEAALTYELPRKLPPRGHYDRRKRAVFEAEYGHRGPAWRRLLNAARRESEDEVGQVLAYTLYWTGEESRTDSRMGELLLRGAERVAAHTGQRKIEQQAHYKRLLAAGHRLRGTHCWGPSAANFEAARALASRYPYLPEWEPILAHGLVRSRALSLDGNHEGAVSVLDWTLEAYLEADPPTSVANESVRHLRAQKCEIESLRYRSEDPARARELLEEAKVHYDAIGFDRSREKIERQLASVPAAPTAEVPAAPEPEMSTSEPPVDEVDTLQPSDELEVAAAEPTAEPADLDDDWLESIEYPDEAEMNEEYDEKFEDPYEF